MKANHILIVDDDQQIAELIKVTLEEEACEIDIACDGQVALDYLAEHQPDLVILDIKLPRIDGFEVLKQIRKKSNYPVIIITSLCDSASLSQSFVMERILLSSPSGSGAVLELAWLKASKL
jgi:DNA-binding response OmpR family regulator